MKKEIVRFIDLFAGLGGTRIGLEQALVENGAIPECVFTSEIKKHAIDAYSDNFNDDHNISGDIVEIPSDDIPDFDIMLAGFPCQPFSSAGNRKGFLDTRGTLFFQIERILKDKSPSAFLLENVEGLVEHDRENNGDKIGKTLQTILNKLESLGYKVSWSVLNAADFGIPQNRKRVYIVGHKNQTVSLSGFCKKDCVLSDVLESGLPPLKTEFTNTLLSHYRPEELHGKAIKDKRGGKNNIHSWDLEIKGKTSESQRELLSTLLKERRKKHWAISKGMTWMDGMPLTVDEIKTFYKTDNLFENNNLKNMLDDLAAKGYVTFEHPKDLVEETDKNGKVYKVRKPAIHIPKGYNIVVGKLSFEITKILDPKDVTPTLVATDVTRLAVTDGKNLRRLSIREGLRLFGYPDHYILDGVSYQESFDLLGNTVVVPVIKEIAKRIIAGLCLYDVYSSEQPRQATLQIA